MSRRYFPPGRPLYRGSPATSLPPSKPSDLSLRFLVDDINGATLIGSRLNNVLTAFVKGRTIRPEHQSFLRDRGAHALADLIGGLVSESDYAARASSDRTKRQEIARQREAKAVAEEHARSVQAAERDAIMQARLRAAEEKRAQKRLEDRRRYESSPSFIAKQKNQAMLHKYGIHEYIEPADFKRLLRILEVLDSGARLEKDAVVWLKAHSHDYALDKVLIVHHSREAEAFLAEYKRSGDPWQAVNASAHLRKCNASMGAVDLLSKIPVQRLKSNKLNSAVLTTQGGAMRDLGRFGDAQKAGETAHELQPRDYRPCTLLGAVHIQQGDYGTGHEWYRKAEERGAPPAGIDSEIRALLRSMEEDKRRAVIAELLRIDSTRYEWLSDWLRRRN